MNNVYNDKIVITFNAGSYGSYLAWILCMLTLEQEIFEPFDYELGNSHNMRDLHKNNIHHILNPDKIYSKENLNIPKQRSIVKVHPKNKSTQRVKQTLDNLVDIFGKTLLLYPTKSTYLLNIHNFLTKVWGDLHTSLLKTIRKSDIYKNYPDANGIQFENLPNWILREFMSFNVFASWEDQVEWYFPDHYKNKDVHLITIEDILYNTKEMVERIKKIYNLTYIKSFDAIVPYHKKNIKLQKYLDQDKISNDILDALFTNKKMEWDPQSLTIISESFIQKKLRDSGYELKCHNLNTFPNTISDLKRLVI